VRRSLIYTALLALCGAILAGQPAAAPETALPAAARKILEKQFPKCVLAPSAHQIESWFVQYRIPYHPSAAYGDFNDDGQRDYAVQLKCETAEGPVQRAVALVASGNTYELHRLADDPSDPFTFLYVYQKGEKDFDFEAMKPFRYAADSIGLLYFDKTAVTFRWTGDKFHGQEAPGDEEVEAAEIEKAESQN
jgi:hypothetical protein